MRIRRAQQSLVDSKVAVLEDIEDHLLHAAVLMLIKPCLHRLYSDLRCFVLREHEYSCGDTAEGNVLTPVLDRQIKACAIALCQLILMLLHQKRGNDRTRFCQVTTKKFIK